MDQKPEKRPTEPAPQKKAGDDKGKKPGENKPYQESPAPAHDTCSTGSFSPDNHQSCRWMKGRLQTILRRTLGRRPFPQ